MWIKNGMTGTSMHDDSSIQKKSLNLRPSDGFSLVVDAKLKTYYASADTALKQAVELKERFPALQVMVRDNATGIRTPVETANKIEV
jgi:hypothetical protein